MESGINQGKIEAFFMRAHEDFKNGVAVSSEETARGLAQKIQNHTGIIDCGVLRISSSQRNGAIYHKIEKTQISHFVVYVGKGKERIILDAARGKIISENRYLEETYKPYRGIVMRELGKHSLGTNRQREDSLERYSFAETLAGIMTS